MELEGVEMRFSAIVLATGLALVAVPATACVSDRPSAGAVVLNPNGTASTNLPNIARGKAFVVDCGPLGQEGDISVVLSLTGSDEKPTGYSKVLATTARMEHDAIRVDVPDVPHLARHTVDVKVYTVGRGATRACDAGQFRVT
jgi:hypothetical protein